MIFNKDSNPWHLPTLEQSGHQAPSNSAEWSKVVRIYDGYTVIQTKKHVQHVGFKHSQTPYCHKSILLNMFVCRSKINFTSHLPMARPKNKPPPFHGKTTHAPLAVQNGWVKKAGSGLEPTVTWHADFVCFCPSKLARCNCWQNMLREFC